MYAALYGPSVEELRVSLPEIGDGLQAQLHELYSYPDPTAADQLAANLDSARRALLRLAEATRREGRGGEK
jgi:hypothetical protein